MAEQGDQGHRHSDHTPSGWDEPPPPALPSAAPELRPIGGRAARFGVAHELERIQRGEAPATSRQAPRRPLPREHRSATDRVRSWWACRETHPSDVWHRMSCRRGRHVVQGGQRIQVGGRFVNTERRCIWCGAPPSELG